MAALRYKNNLFSYSGLLASNAEIEHISKYLNKVQASMAQADYSELIDLQKYRILRNPVRIKRMLKTSEVTPFVFVTCLN